MSVRINNLTKFYGTQKALDNVSLEIVGGEVVGLLGPNGAGKTTMMRIITCFIPPTSGSIFVSGINVFEDSLEVRRRVGYLPENNPLYAEMYVKEYLRYISGIYRLKGNTELRIKEMIEVVGLQKEQNKKIGMLSKGYRQRVGLAQAMIHNPEVLILDEPTSGLDPNQIVEIRRLIKEIGREKTVLLSTHIMQEVEAVCGRVVIIDKGRIIKDDITANIHKIKSNKETVIVEFNFKVTEGMVMSIDGVMKVNNVRDNIWEIETKSGIDIRTDIFNFAVKNNIAVISMRKEEKTLEQVFQQLTK
jgi:ABC-2 type transport system ATP-binding protein